MRVGQKVVCVDASGGGPLLAPPLVVGNTYIVHGVLHHHCGYAIVDVGIRPPSYIPLFCVCGDKIVTNSIWWCRASRFRPLEERGETTVEEILETIGMVKE
jgi:hypothetical protein